MCVCCSIIAWAPIASSAILNAAVADSHSSRTTPSIERLQSGVFFQNSDIQELPQLKNERLSDDQFALGKNVQAMRSVHFYFSFFLVRQYFLNYVLQWKSYADAEAISMYQRATGVLR
jgi:hypothetical protein